MKAEEIFARLGFNALESEVYVALLKNGPQTAYRIGKFLGRPTANVYKAVEVLLGRGAITIEEGEKQVCHAVPVRTLAKQLQSQYTGWLDDAVEHLGRLKPETGSEGIYKLQTPEAVFEKAIEMLSRCRKIVVIDAFPKSLEKLSGPLNKLAEKGIEVMLEAYAPVKLNQKISSVIPRVSPESVKHWKAEQLNMVIDGREFLVALFSEHLDRLVQANYSNNLYLSCIMHNGMISEHRVQQWMNAAGNAEYKTLRKKHRYLFNSDVPGLKQLFDLYR